MRSAKLRLVIAVTGAMLGAELAAACTASDSPSRSPGPSTGSSGADAGPDDLTFGPPIDAGALDGGASSDGGGALFW